MKSGNYIDKDYVVQNQWNYLNYSHVSFVV